jgi:K+-sensing histidine kinase KdpD
MSESVVVSLPLGQREADPGLRKAAHDIRTPLASIMQCVDALLDLPDETNDRARSLFEMLRRNVLWMGQVLEGAVGHTRVGDQEVELHTLMADLRALVTPLLNVRDQTLVIDSRPARISIRAEHAGIARAVLNLIENASKYGPPGDELRVLLRRKGSSTIVSVCDHGPGIRRSERRAVFSAFYRTPETRASGLPGVGLGLAVVGDVVQRHGGTVGVGRIKGETRVWFCLPDQDDRSDR